MARSLWKGAISFGLVNVPVELFPAEERKGFEFSMLDKRDFPPVGYKRYNKKSGKEVEWANIVKGYEYEKDRYVVLSDEDFRRANVKASRTIDIKAFVPAGEIPAQFFETPYYLAPGERGEKVYALLRETLRSTGRIAVGDVVIRTTQHLAAVVPMERALMLITLRYADELRGTRGLELPAASLKSVGVTGKELELAKRLVDDMGEHWNPDEFKDTYHQDLMRRIHEKIKRGETKEITRPERGEEGEPRSAQVIDLAALLKRSLEASAPRKKPHRAARSKSEARSEARKPSLRLVASARGSSRPAGEAQARVTVRDFPHGARTVPRKARLPGDAGAARADRPAPDEGASIRRAETRGASHLHYDFRLELERRPAELGGSEGTEPRSARQAARDARRGPPAGVRRLRGRHSAASIRLGHRHRRGIAGRGTRSAIRTRASLKAISSSSSTAKSSRAASR